MISKVLLSATLTAAALLAPATFARDVHVEADGVTLAKDELVDEAAAVSRDLLARRKVVFQRKVVVAKTSKNKNKNKAKKGNNRPPAAVKNLNNGDEGNEGNEGNEGIACADAEMRENVMCTF
jgi:hypothetical protein